MQAENLQGKQIASKTWQRLGRDFYWLILAILLLLATILVSEYFMLPAPVALAINVTRLLLGLAYVLFMPGYCLTAALFPADTDLDGIERTGLSSGLSVAWIAVLALLLDQLPWGLTFWPILIGELLSILIFAVIALFRRGRMPSGEAYAPAVRLQPRARWRAQPTLSRLVYLLAALTLLVTSLAVAWTLLVPSDDTFMTEFYILGQGGFVEDYPRQSALGEELKVTMGITNREQLSDSYTVEVWAVDPRDGRRQLVSTTSPITLNPGETIRQTLTWQMPWAGTDQIVDFYLIADKHKQDGPYRALRLWLDVNQDEAE